MPTTQVLWITRDRVTPIHIRGLLEALTKLEALDYAEVRILPVGEDDTEHGVAIPAAAISSINGQPVDVRADGTVLITAENLPPQGIIWAPE